MLWRAAPAAGHALVRAAVRLTETATAPGAELVSWAPAEVCEALPSLAGPAAFCKSCAETGQPFTNCQARRLCCKLHCHFGGMHTGAEIGAFDGCCAPRILDCLGSELFHCGILLWCLGRMLLGLGDCVRIRRMQLHRICVDGVVPQSLENTRWLMQRGLTNTDKTSASCFRVVAPVTSFACSPPVLTCTASLWPHWPPCR